MQEIIRANARYWLKVLGTSPDDVLLSESELRGAAKAIEAALQAPDLWDVTKSLAQALHPHMERRGYWADWNNFLQALAAHANEQGDSQAEAEILLWHGIVQRQRGDFSGATISCRRAWWLSHRLKNKVMLARIFSQLGDLYRLREQFWRAERLCRAATRCFESDEYIGDLAQAENRLGLVFFDQLRYDDALPLLLHSEQLWQQLGDSHGLAKVLHNLGELHRRTGHLDKALNYLEQAGEHYLAAGDKVYDARMRLNIGNIYLNQGDLHKADKTFLEAETSLRYANDSLDLANARHNLGIVYTRMRIWSEAEACFARAIEQWRARGDIWREANTLGEMGMLYLARGDRAGAKNYLDQAWRLIRPHRGARFDLLRQELAERRKLVT